MSRAPKPRFCVLAALLCACCGDDDAPADVPDADLGLEPPMAIDGGDPTGGPAVELGYYYERTYDPFEPGDDCPIFYGLQGGSWTMPAVRLRGLTSPARIEASFVTQSGETLGELDQMHSFNNQVEGWIEIKRLPIPATHEPPNDDDPIDDLFGQNATLSLRVSDDEGNEASASAEVVLADNPVL